MTEKIEYEIMLKSPCGDRFTTWRMGSDEAEARRVAESDLPDSRVVRIQPAEPLWSDKYDVRLLADECYPSPPETEVQMNHEQLTSLFRKWKQQEDHDLSWGDFVRSVQPTHYMDGAVVVQWCGMWLAIERDGYTHS